MGFHLFGNLAQFGWIRVNFFPKFTWLHENVFHFAHVVSLVPMLLFGSFYMSLRTKSPRLFKVLVLAAAFSSVFAGFGLISNSLVADMGQQVCASIFFLVLLITATIQSTKQRQAKFFLAAWSVILVSWIINFLRIDGYFSDYFALQFSILFGAATEGAILSFALADRLNCLRREKDQVSRQNAELKAVSTVAAQVSHDIRSPLSALSMIISSLDEVSEEKRFVLRSAFQRINDITNHLQQKGKSASNARPGSSFMLIAAIDKLISEKRMQYRERLNIQIRGDLDEGYGLFSSIDPVEFARVLSNLINNSAEALVSGGQVVIRITSDRDCSLISISDNGVGIPMEILNQLGRPGVTYGKVGRSYGGSGLGIYHAKRTVEDAGGSMVIESKVGVGTLVKIRLPKEKAPSWFVKSLDVNVEGTVVSLDDDQTIHQVWSRRLSAEDSRSSRFTGEHIILSSIGEFRDWYANHRRVHSLYLIDFEFLKEKENGLYLGENSRTLLAGAAPI